MTEIKVPPALLERVGPLDDGPPLPAQINHLSKLVGELFDRVVRMESVLGEGRCLDCQYEEEDE